MESELWPEPEPVLDIEVGAELTGETLSLVEIAEALLLLTLPPPTWELLPEGVMETALI